MLPPVPRNAAAFRSVVAATGGYGAGGGPPSGRREGAVPAALPWRDGADGTFPPSACPAAAMVKLCCEAKDRRRPAAGGLRWLPA